jgi:uncharacterized membrane protein YidH (DUF202 family)
MKKLLIAALYLLIAGWGIAVMGFTISGTFASSGIATEIAMLSLGFLIACFSIATIPLAIKTLIENDK